MNETTRRSSRQPPWEGDVGHEAGAFGGWLRREREAREVTLGEISDVTKISRAYLEALEDERFDVLPAPVFAKGFLREYAKYVGLDPDEVVNSFLTALQASEPEATTLPAAVPRRGFEWKSGALLAAGLVLLLGAIGFLGFWAERSQTHAVEAEAAAVVPEVPAPEPVVEEAEPAVPVQPPPDITGPVAPLVVTIDFTDDCWVEAAVDGRRRLSELHVQGESLQIDAEERVDLTLGNPGAVRVEVNGRPYSLPEYRPGQVARDIVIALEDGE